MATSGLRFLLFVTPLCEVPWTVQVSYKFADFTQIDISSILATCRTRSRSIYLRYILSFEFYI